MTPAPPGRDEITVTAPQGRHLCNSRTCRKAGKPADLIATFGALADPGALRHSRDTLWPDCWGKSYPLCTTCWDRTREAATARRPGLIIRDTTTSPATSPPSSSPVASSLVNARRHLS